MTGTCGGPLPPKSSAPTIYVAGPYTQGDVALNVGAAIWTANQLMHMGWMPYVPHLSHFWHITYKWSYQRWISLGLVWLERSDAVLRMPGESMGADIECDRASGLDIPIFFGLEKCPMAANWSRNAD